MITREPIYAGVFAFFAGLTAGGSPLFRTATRKLDSWEGVTAEDQPALLMRQMTETAERVRGLPTKWRLDIRLLVYVHTGAQNDKTIVPAQVLNPLLDAIEASLAVDDPSNNACTLGGLVSSCAIQGPIEIYQGDLGDEEVAVIPISIVVST